MLNLILIILQNLIKTTQLYILNKMMTPPNFLKSRIFQQIFFPVLNHTMPSHNLIQPGICLSKLGGDLGRGEGGLIKII